MEPKIVISSWISRGLSDLYFGFDTVEVDFSDYSLFFELMGLEKFLKAVYLYKRRSEYKNLPDQAAKKKVNALAKSLHHNFKEIINEELKDDLGSKKIEDIMNKDFNGYCGSQLINAAMKGYSETRYPSPNPAYLSFPIPSTNLYWNPLSSSGMRNLIYALCKLCYQYLENVFDFSNILEIFNQKFEHKDSFRRFSNVFWNPTEWDSGGKRLEPWN